MNKRVLVLTVAVSSALSGCGMFGDDGMFRNRSADYLEAQEVPPIVVPEHLDDDSIGQLYPIPPVPETNVLEEFETVPRPQSVALNDLSEVVKIQSLGDERWILSNRSPSEIWPRVRNILNRSGIPTARAEASRGILETVWLEFEGDDSSNHRYRFYIQPGVQVNSTEIKVLHDRVSKEAETREAWPEVSVDDSREEDMVEILANALAGDVTSGTFSLQAQSIGGEQKVEFVTPAVADPYLLMKLDMKRAWASLAYSLDKEGFTVIDQNQSEGMFYVNYTPPEDEGGGWFSRWFGSDNDKLEINYQIRATDSPEGVEVRVLNEEGAGIDRQQAIRLLKTVRTNLS